MLKTSSPRWTMAIAVLFGVAAVVFAASPAQAHVEVEADKTQAGATDVTLTFNGEAESITAGIVSERVVLPAGITSDQVKAGKLPSGWKLTPAADGFTVAGKALKVKDDAVFSVIVAKLPTDQSVLVFKTIETYSDGKISRWIDVPENGQESDNPAPTVKVKGATKAASPAASTPASAPASATAAAPSVAAAPSATEVVAEPAAESTSSSAWIWVTVAVVVLLVIGGGVVAVSRRRS